MRTQVPNGRSLDEDSLNYSAFTSNTPQTQVAPVPGSGRPFDRQFSQFSQLSEGLAQDVRAMLLEMNKKIELLTERADSQLEKGQGLSQQSDNTGALPG